jgi:GAF domain-containing protein
MLAEGITLSMPKTRSTKSALPGKLDLVFSTFIEVTGLITTGASMSRIVSPILGCACEILGGRAAFAILQEKRTYTRISHIYMSSKGRHFVKEESIKLGRLGKKVFARRKAGVLSDVGSMKEIANITGYDRHRQSDAVIIAGLHYRRTKTGTIGVVTSGEQSPEAEDLGLFELLAREAGVAIKNAS